MTETRKIEIEMCELADAKLDKITGGKPAMSDINIVKHTDAGSGGLTPVGSTVTVVSSFLELVW